MSRLEGMRVEARDRNAEGGPSHKITGTVVAVSMMPSLEWWCLVQTADGTLESCNVKYLRVFTGDGRPKSSKPAALPVPREG